jgi:N-acetylglutamate synthase-like GNAT family acetyltransferase
MSDPLAGALLVCGSSRGIGTELVRWAVVNAQAAGCEWLHVDFEPELARFYFDACGFGRTDAGLVHLSTREGLK